MSDRVYGEFKAKYLHRGVGTFGNYSSRSVVYTFTLSCQLETTLQTFMKNTKQELTFTSLNISDIENLIIPLPESAQMKYQI